MIEDLFTAAVAYVPVVVGLVELAKRLGMGERWAPLLSLALGLAFGLVYVAPGDPRAAALAGTLLGLAASGLYSGAKTTATSFRRQAE